MLDFLQKNKDISHLSNFQTPAITQWYFEINEEKDTEKLKDIIDLGKKVLFIGGGTNMLFAFDTFEGVVIKNNLDGWNYNIETQILESYSNEPISDIAESLEDDFGQSLWHRFIGLPGSIGGAIFGNAGCFGLEAENNFIEASLINLENGHKETLSKKNMKFNYRSSLLKQNYGKYFLIQARFDLSKKVEKYASDVDNLYFREHKQPKGNTCGSFFKNPSREQSAGYLIEQVGLKGYKIGGAYFSKKHANFLMNDGSGNYKDLQALITLAQKKVKEQFGIDLVNEVRIILT